MWGKSAEALLIARQANDAAASASSAATKAMAAIEQHAAVCNLRQQGIDNTLNDIKGFLKKVFWGLIIGLFGIIGFGFAQIATNGHWLGGAGAVVTTTTTTTGHQQ
jgi:hypothetical protein